MYIKPPHAITHTTTNVMLILIIDFSLLGASPVKIVNPHFVEKMGK